MAKENKAADAQPVIEVARSEVSVKLHSVDQENGIVVFKTDAENGVGFTCKINGQSIDALADNGELWFYAGQPIGQTPAITLL